MRRCGRTRSSATASSRWAPTGSAKWRGTSGTCRTAATPTGQSIGSCWRKGGARAARNTRCSRRAVATELHLSVSLWLELYERTAATTPAKHCAEPIAPDQIGRYKPARHRAFVLDWAAANRLDPAHVWEAREACIAALSTARPRPPPCSTSSTSTTTCWSSTNRPASSPRPTAPATRTSSPRPKAFLKKKFDKPGNVFVGLVHRLDRPVSGVMVLARTSKSASRLAEQFRKREPEKTYLAAVEGRLVGNGEQEDYLLKDGTRGVVRRVQPGTAGAKRARLRWAALQVEGHKTLVEVELLTGRAHQIPRAARRPRPPDPGRPEVRQPDAVRARRPAPRRAGHRAARGPARVRAPRTPRARFFRCPAALA